MKNYIIKGIRKGIRKGITALALSCALTSISNFGLASQLNDSKKVEKDVDTLDSVYEIINSNKELNKQSKEYIMNFVNTLDGDFDLTIFKANLKNLRIDIMDEEEYFNSHGDVGGTFSIKNNYIIVPDDESCEKRVDVILFWFLRCYYKGNSNIDFHVWIDENATTKCFGKYLGYELCYHYYDMYFSNGSKYMQSNEIVLKLINILGSERIKYYFEQGTVLDTVDDLASIYGDKKTAIHLINMMDEINTDEEKYEQNIKEINTLLDQYLEAKNEKEKNQISLPNYFTKDVEEIVSILNETSNCEEEYKREVFSKLLDVLYTKYYNRQYDSRLLDNDFNNALATIYVECSNLGIYSDSYGFLEFIGKTNYLCKCDRKTFLSYEQIRNNVRKKMSSNYILDVEDIFTRSLV